MNDKARIRKEVLKKRDGIDIKSRKEKDILIKQRLFALPEFGSANMLFYFASFGSEVSTLLQIKELLGIGKRIILPRVDKNAKGLRLYEIKDLAELSPGVMGILEPHVRDSREIDVNSADFVVMPGVAFDSQCNRIGYGAGYYDKLLSGLKRQMPLVAITYEEQIVEKVPAEPHDVRVHKIVTDTRLIQYPYAGEGPHAKKL